ncbi:MAG: ribosome recycling factor [Desulfuromonas sp.]|nr:MAG: ribosome recycling factor [Desulfuromonas sp.]
MIKDVMSKARQSMDGAIDALKRELTRVRTGRASVSLLDEVRVDYYGTTTPLNQVGTLAVPEARMITVQPWEKNLLPEIEKAIFKSDLGLTPSSDGELIRIAIPALTEERRKEMVKLVKSKSEDAKISIRGARRDGNDALKKLEKEKEITEDDLKRSEKEMQDLTDKYVKKCDEIVTEKEQELMEV